jgi:hypothetical protein
LHHHGYFFSKFNKVQWPFKVSLTGHGHFR